jgi:DNA-binding PadR family transcriptional regulator
MDSEELSIGLLYLLGQSAPTGDGLGYTFEEIMQFIEMNNIPQYFEEDSGFAENLLKLLKDMEKQGLIEERHFGEEDLDRVDYSITNKGINFIEDKEKECKKNGKPLEKRWVIIK